MTTPPRPLGDFSGFDLPDSGLAVLVRQLDPHRLTVVYVRKSDPSGHKNQAAYLMVQEAVPEALVRAGVDRARLILLEGDTGKSAWLSRKFRADLNNLYERIGADEVGTVVVRDISRIFRDTYLKESTDFCARMARFNTKLLTTFGGEWALLDLRKDGDREQFMRGAREAAAYRKTWRAQSMASKELSSMKGNYTGGPAPFGGGVVAGRARHDTPDGIALPPRFFVYPPHAQMKLKIMEISLLPQLDSYAALHRHLLDHEITVPPFDPQTAKESFPRSCLSRVWTHTAKDGTHTALKPDASFVPSPRMLHRILLEPLALGIRLYGTGKGGKYAVAKHTRMADEMDMPPDILVRIEKVWAGKFPDLAICTTPEQVALFWRVAEKWSPQDMREAVSSHFEQAVPNPEQTAGKVRIRRDTPYRPSNPWAQRVWCMKHGKNEDGSPALTHLMAMHSGGHSWECYTDTRAGRRVGSCAIWGCDNALGRILDTHFKRGLTAALQSQHAIIRSLVDDRDERKRTADQLKTEVAELTAEKDLQLNQAGAYQRSLEGMEASFVEAELDRFHRERVRPVLASLAEKQRDLRKAEASGLANPPDTSEREIRDLLKRLVSDWDTLPVQERRFAISVFVSYVGVMVGDGFDGKEAVVEFAWTDGAVDRLVGWRGHWPDERPWTEEEDEAIRTLWPSTCDWPEMREKLQEKRTFRRARIRARELGVAKGANRPDTWVERHLNGDRSWGERHPDVLYLQMHPNRDEEAWCLAVAPDGTGTVIEFPEEVREGVISVGYFMSPLKDASWM